MSQPHWNYFLAIEESADRISQYVEFVQGNYSTYSVEIARLFMTATQEIDVLLKQICHMKGSTADNECAYRRFIPTVYPTFSNAEVQISRYDLSFKPYLDWSNLDVSRRTTPTWWTANNKVKHERHTHFNMASLGNMLNAISGLLIANIYYHDACGKINDLFPGTKHLYPVDMVSSSSPTIFGMVPNYKIL
jgi:hypothetical protein